LEEPAAQGKYAASFGARVQNYQWPKPAPNDATDTVHLVMKLYRDGIYNSGMETRETAEFRHVYADYVRCVDVLVAHGKVDPKRIVATGASRTGPAALAAAALDHRIALVDIHVPTSAGISWSTRFYRGWGAHGSAGRPADVPLEKWLRLLAYFDMVNFASDVRCPVIIGLGLRDYDLSPAPGIIAAYALLPGDKALGVSPWEGHCYPEAFQRLQVSYRRKHLAGDRRSGSLPLTSPLRYTCVILGETKFIPLHTECAGCSAMARILITSGPTREHLDPVRYLTNASSGQMGRALTAAALRAGHEAVVVSGPVDVEYPAPAEVLRVVTTQEMLDACRRVFPECDGLIAVAAPCDYRPAKVAAHKIKKTGRGLDLHLVETPDIVAALGASKRPSQWMVAFALETEDPRFRAMQKLERKRCDLIVLNGPAAIHSSRTAAEVIDRQGAVLATLSGPKDEVAEAILRIVGSRLIAKPA
jgi:phosphopantothenoylcysteine decarboxylase/phosphopantothenate--cysteine ligase